MKIPLALMVVLLWQADFGSPGAGTVSAADPQHLRYERSITLPAGAVGDTCAVLDASVYAHAGNWSEGDLRVFREVGKGTAAEVPFAVSYSEARPTDAVIATVQNLRLQRDEIVFDLAMPRRAYTVVDLQLAAKNFIATAEVSGSDGKGGTAKSLGTFTLFDFTQERLARSTSLAMQESSFADLHVKLRMRGVDGGTFPDLSGAIVEGATVPASREAQTLYTVVASTSKSMQERTSSVAQVEVPAHLPIERVNFLVEPGYKADFLRKVKISAGRDVKALGRPEEVIDGEIWRVTRAGEEAIHAAKLTQIAVIASNLREAAAVRIAIENGSAPPLPIKAIQLEMRQRTICFDAVAGATYTLRYGDEGLRASVYDLGALAKGSSKPQVAVLGPEVLNREYVPRRDAKSYDQRNPERYWIALLAAIAALGALASRHTKRRGRHR